MRYLLDTHLLLWLATGDTKALSRSTLDIVEDADNILMFSAASIWEVAIKNALGKPDFEMDPSILLRGLLDHGYTELPITGHHAAAVGLQPTSALHHDPFDRLLLSQAKHEGIPLLTTDRAMMQYPAYTAQWAGKGSVRPPAPEGSGKKRRS